MRRDDALNRAVCCVSCYSRRVLDLLCIERGLHLPLEFLLSCLFELCGICVVLYGRTACRSRYVDTFDLDTWTLQTCIFPPSQAEIRPCFVRVRLKHGSAPSAPVPARVAPAKDRYWSWYFPPLKRFAPASNATRSKVRTLMRSFSFFGCCWTTRIRYRYRCPPSCEFRYMEDRRLRLSSIRSRVEK